MQGVNYREVGTQSTRIWFATSDDTENEALETCWVSSATLSALYAAAPRADNGAKPGMKKWRRGKGTILTANLRKSAFSWPGKRRHVVTPDIVTETAKEI